MTARAGHFVRGSDHLVESCAHQFNCFALAHCGVVHVTGHLTGVRSDLLQIGGSAADAPHQLRDHAKKLVEPTSQSGGFVLAPHFQFAGQIALPFGDFL
ncbi:hypothetical protein D3C81_1308180 [compost metagenome]